MESFRALRLTTSLDFVTVPHRPCVQPEDSIPKDTCLRDQQILEAKLGLRTPRSPNDTTDSFIFIPNRPHTQPEPAPSLINSHSPRWTQLWPKILIPTVTQPPPSKPLPFSTVSPKPKNLVHGKAYALKALLANPEDIPTPFGGLGLFKAVGNSFQDASNQPPANSTTRMHLVRDLGVLRGGGGLGLQVCSYGLGQGLGFRVYPKHQSLNPKPQPLNPKSPKRKPCIPKPFGFGFRVYPKPQGP